MLGSSTKRNGLYANYSDPQNGQSLFQFLKRKKKFALQQSVIKNKLNNTVQLDNQHNLSSTPLNQTKRHNQRYTNKFETTNITPKRVKFMEVQDKKVNRSFIEMISPLKRKTQDIARSVTPDRLDNISSKKIQKDNYTYTRKNLTQKINQMKQTLQSFIRSGMSVKQKSHSLWVQMKPILKFVQQNGNNLFMKKAEEVRMKLKVFETACKVFDIENSDTYIENFYRSFSEYMNSIESQLRNQYEKKSLQSTLKLKNDKQVRIQQLSNENNQLSKQIQMLQRKLQKFNKMSNKLLNDHNQKQQYYGKRFQQTTADYEQKIQFLEQSLEQTKKKLEQSQQSCKQFQKLAKSAQYIRQEQQKRFRQDVQSVKSRKQQYLLNQIMILKKEFQNDMSQITQLYNVKQAQNLKNITELHAQLNNVTTQRQYDKQLQDKILVQLNLAKPQIHKLKRQNQCLVTDMHRMNEQLYQHWLALKDIKTLLVRLQLYPKFSRIYDDLSYNEYLFG